MPNILAVIIIAKNTGKYGFRNVRGVAARIRHGESAFGDEPRLIAALADSNVDYIRSLNPSFRRDMTPPGEAYLLPRTA